MTLMVSQACLQSASANYIAAYFLTVVIIVGTGLACGMWHDAAFSFHRVSSLGLACH
jgi:hypothetical protein